jgi:hypothetical protein
VSDASMNPCRVLGPCIVVGENGRKPVAVLDRHLIETFIMAILFRKKVNLVEPFFIVKLTWEQGG